MQAYYAEHFEREMGCTEADWLRWLPEAMGEHPWTLQTGTVGVRIGDGALGLKWQAAASHVIGLIHSPMLRVSFAGLDDAQMSDEMPGEPDWDMAAQSAPDYEVDQRINC